MSQETLKILPSYLEPIAKTSALVGGVLYVSGFLIINAYLAKYGFADYNVISSRFIFSGASFFLGCIIWWIVCGRLHCYKELTRFTSASGDSRADNKLSFAAQAALLIARSVAASLTICFVLFGTGVVVLPGLALIAMLLFIEAIISTTPIVDTSPSKITAGARLLLSILSIALFYTMFRPSDEVFALFHMVLSLEGVALPLGDMIKNNKLFDLKPFVSPMYYCLMVIFYLVSYGNQFFDKIQPRLGGGLSRNVVLSTKDPVVLGSVSSGPGNVLTGRMLYSNDRMIVMVVDQQVIAIAADQIRATIIDTKTDQMLTYRMSKTVRRIGLPWHYNPFKKEVAKGVSIKGFFFQARPKLTCLYDWQYSCATALGVR